jgi:hypothetical protein
VIDATSNINQIRQIIMESKAALVQAEQYAMQIEQKVIEAQQLAGFIHDPSLGAALGLMDRTGLGNSLPVDPRELQALTSGVNGLGGLASKLQQLFRLAGASYADNHVYAPTDGSWNSQQLITNANGIAGNQGAAQAAYADYQRHMPVVQALGDRLATATNPKDVADAHAALQSEIGRGLKSAISGLHGIPSKPRPPRVPAFQVLP